MEQAVQALVEQQELMAGSQAYQVKYDASHDEVELVVGSTTLHMAATRFFMLHETMRKAAARLVMQTEIEGGEHSMML